MSGERQAFIDAEQQLQEARARHDAALQAHQDTCKHETVYEVDYNPERYGQLAAPKRVCAICGWAERGWHCGYGRLNVPASRVSKYCTEENFDRLRRGAIHQWTPRADASRGKTPVEKESA
jgi:hypothetical protein